MALKKWDDWNVALWVRPAECGRGQWKSIMRVPPALGILIQCPYSNDMNDCTEDCRLGVLRDCVLLCVENQHLPLKPCTCLQYQCGVVGRDFCLSWDLQEENLQEEGYELEVVAEGAPCVWRDINGTSLGDSPGPSGQGNLCSKQAAFP